MVLVDLFFTMKSNDLRQKLIIPEAPKATVADG